MNPQQMQDGVGQRVESHGDRPEQGPHYHLRHRRQQVGAGHGEPGEGRVELRGALQVLYIRL